jgi:hypothetical protein
MVTITYDSLNIKLILQNATVSHIFKTDFADSISVKGHVSASSQIFNDLKRLYKCSKANNPDPLIPTTMTIKTNYINCTISISDLTINEDGNDASFTYILSAGLINDINK